MKLFGKTLFDWSKIHTIAPEARKEEIVKRFSKFLKMVNNLPHENVIGAKALGADPTLVGADHPIAYRLTDTIKTPDRGYEVLFDEVDMRQSTQKAFDIMDITGGVTFYQMLPGEEAKLSVLPKASKVSVSMMRFIGGFPILDDWLRFNEYYRIDELAGDTIRRWYDMKANLHYGLLAALSSGINQSFSTDDVTTINNACTTIQTDLAALGYPVAENPSFWIIANPTLKMRIMKALASAFLNPNSNSATQIVFPIAGIINTVKVANTSYYVALAGEKSKRGEWEDLNARPPQRNELKLGADHVWTGAFNSAIGEAKQFRRCALS